MYVEGLCNSEHQYRPFEAIKSERFVVRASSLGLTRDQDVCPRAPFAFGSSLAPPCSPARDASLLALACCARRCRGSPATAAPGIRLMMPGFDFRKSGPGKTDHSVLVGVRSLQGFLHSLGLTDDDGRIDGVAAAARLRRVRRIDRDEL